MINEGKAIVVRTEFVMGIEPKNLSVERSTKLHVAANKHNKYPHLLRQIMKLLDFFGGNPLRLFPRVRKDDPITSYEASDKVNFAGEHYDIILGCLTKYGPLGKDGIASRTNLDSSQVARRLPEMAKLDFIEPTGQTVKSNAGRSEREWRLKGKHHA